MRFGFDREQEPEILDSGRPERDPPRGRSPGWPRLARTWLRAFGGWLAGRGQETKPGGQGGFEPPRYKPLLARVPRWALVGAVVILLVAGGAALNKSRGRPSPQALPTNQALSVPPACAPYMDGNVSGLPSGYRVMFGQLGVPPSLSAGLRTLGRASWPYGMKTGLWVRDSEPPVSIGAAPGWRGTVALAAPNSVTSTLHLPTCPPKGSWYMYVTVFYLHSPTACVPLRVTVKHQAGTIWLGVGKRCVHSS